MFEEILKLIEFMKTTANDPALMEVLKNIEEECRHIKSIDDVGQDVYNGELNDLKDAIKSDDDEFKKNCESNIRGYNADRKKRVNTFREYLCRQQDLIERAANDALDDEMHNEKGNTLPSESIKGHLNAYVLISEITDCLGQYDTEKRELKKKLPDPAGKSGFEFLYEKYPSVRKYDSMVNGLKGKVNSSKNYRDVIMVLLDEAGKDLMDVIPQGRKDVFGIAYQNCDRAVFQRVRPADSLDGACDPLIEKPYEELVRTSRKELAEITVFRDYNRLKMDNTLILISDYLERGYSIDKITGDELACNIFDPGNFDITDFTTKKKYEDPAEYYYDFLETCFAKGELFEKLKLTGKSFDVSFATLDFLNQPGLKAELKALKRDEKNGVEYFRSVVKAMDKYGLRQHVKDLKANVGKRSMEAVKNAASKVRNEMGGMLIGPVLVKNLEEYIVATINDGAEQGLQPLPPAKEAKESALSYGMKPVPRRYQLLEGHVPNIYTYMKMYDAYMKRSTPTLEQVREIRQASQYLSGTLMNIFGDPDLTTNLKKDMEFLTFQERILTNTKQKTDLRETQVLKRYLFQADKIEKIPSEFERALCMVGLYLKDHKIENMTEADFQALSCINACDARSNNGLFDHIATKDIFGTLTEGFNQLKYYREDKNQFEPFSKRAKKILIDFEMPGQNKNGLYIDPRTNETKMKDLKRMLGQMKLFGQLDDILAANRMYLVENYPNAETEDARLLVERCQKLFKDKAFLNSLKTGRQFNKCFEMSQECAFDDFLKRLNQVDVDEKNFALTKENTAILTEIKDSMPIVFNSSLDTNEENMHQLFDIMVQIKHPDGNPVYGQPMTAREYMQLVDLFSENKISKKLDKIVDDFNCRLLLSDHEKHVIKKVHKNQYESTKDTKSFSEYSKDIFVNGNMNNMPFKLSNPWDMKAYNINGQTHLSKEECIYQTLVRYKQLANYLPYVGKIYQEDQKKVDEVKGDRKAKEDALRANRHGNFIMSQIINLQAHDIDNTPGVEAYLANQLFDVLESEFNEAVKENRQGELYDVLAINLCFDERTRKIQEYAENRKLKDAVEIVEAPVNYGLYFRTEERYANVFAKALAAENLMGAVSVITEALTDDYAKVIPGDDITVDMLEQILYKMLCGVEIEKNIIDKKDIDRILDDFVLAETAYRKTEDERLADLQYELGQAGYIWNSSWDEEKEREAIDYATKLFGYHNLKPMLEKDDSVISKVLSIPADRTSAPLKEQMEKKKKAKALEERQREQKRKALRKNRIKLGEKTEAMRWNVMDSRTLNAAGLAQDEVQRLIERPKALRELFSNAKISDVVKRWGDRSAKDAMLEIQNLLSKTDEEIADVYRFMGTSREARLLDNVKRVLNVASERIIFGDLERTFPQFEKVFPNEKWEDDKYRSKDLTFHKTNRYIREYMTQFIQGFAELNECYMNELSDDEKILANNLSQRLNNVKNEIIFIEDNHYRFSSDEAARYFKIVETATEFMELHMNPSNYDRGVNRFKEASYYFEKYMIDDLGAKVEKHATLSNLSNDKYYMDGVLEKYNDRNSEDYVNSLIKDNRNNMIGLSKKRKSITAELKENLRELGLGKFDSSKYDRISEAYNAFAFVGYQEKGKEPCEIVDLSKAIAVPGLENPVHLDELDTTTREYLTSINTWRMNQQAEANFAKAKQDEANALNHLKEEGRTILTHEYALEEGKGILPTVQAEVKNRNFKTTTREYFTNAEHGQKHVLQEDLKNSKTLLDLLHTTYHTVMSIKQESSTEYKRVEDTLGRIRHLEEIKADRLEILRNYRILERYCNDYLNKRSPEHKSGAARYKLVTRACLLSEKKIRSIEDILKDGYYEKSTRKALQPEDLKGNDAHLNAFLDKVADAKIEVEKKSLDNRDYLKNAKGEDLTKIGLLVLFETQKQNLKAKADGALPQGNELVERLWTAIQSDDANGINAMASQLGSNAFVKKNYRTSDGINKLLYAGDGEVMHAIAEQGNQRQNRNAEELNPANENHVDQANNNNNPGLK